MTYDRNEWLVESANRRRVQEMCYRAYEPVVEFFANVEDLGGNNRARYQTKRNSQYVNSTLPPMTSYARQRFDWEIRNVTLPEITQRGLVQLMMDDFANDFTSLVIHGDVNNTSDPLYKTMNGEKVRNKRAINIEITGGEIYRQVIPQAGKVEFTFFSLTLVDWEDNDY